MTYFVSTDEGCLGGYRPISLGGMEVGMADTGAVHLDEAFSREKILRLGNGFVVADYKASTCRWNDGGLHGLGNGFKGRHCWS